MYFCLFYIYYNYSQYTTSVKRFHPSVIEIECLRNNSVVKIYVPKQTYYTTKSWFIYHCNKQNTDLLSMIFNSYNRQENKLILAKVYNDPISYTFRKKRRV